MVEKSNNYSVYVANVGNSRKERMWNKVTQVEKVLEDLENHKAEIIELHLSNNSIGLEVSEALASKISKLNNLNHAGFNDIFVSRLKEEIPKSINSLITSIANKTILILNLSDNAFGPNGVDAFDFYLRSNTTLNELYLENNGLGPEGASAVAEALKSNKNMFLKKLRIGRNRLENKGASAFGEYFTLTNSLIEVIAFQNGIKDEGMANFLNGLSNNADLEILKVNDNVFGNKSVEKLLKLLDIIKNLKIIDISDSKLGCENSISIFEKLSKLDTLKEIYCNYNEIEEKEAQNKIVDFLINLKIKLDKLEIKGNEIKKSIFKKIKTNEKLKEAEVYSESEMDEEELNELMSGLTLN